MRFILFFILLLIPNVLALTTQGNNVVLFAQHHHELYDLDGGRPLSLQRFASLLEQQGMDVLSIKQGRIDREVLDGVDILVLSYPQEDLLQMEITAIKEYVARGGGLVVLGGQLCRDYVNPLLREFGMEVAYDVVQIEGNADLLLKSGDHGVFSFVEEFEYLHAPLVRVENPEWIVYPSPTAEENLALFALRSYEEGAVFVSGDADFMNNGFVEQYDNAQLGFNIIRYAAGEAPVRLKTGIRDRISLFVFVFLLIVLGLLLVKKIR